MKNKILSLVLLISGLSLFLNTTVFAQVGLKVDTNGNVGINNSTPAFTLDVNGNIRATSWSRSRLAYVLDDSTTGGPVAQIREIGGGIQGMRFTDGGVANEWLRINSTGNLGIGTTNPQYKLHVESAGTTIYSNTTGSSVYAGRFNGATHGLLGYAGTYGVVGISYAAGTKFGVYGDAQGVGYDFFAINTDGSVAYGSASSIRQKANITRISNPLDKVMAIEGVSFDWKGSGVHNIGFIAERLGEIVPEIVVFEDASNESNWYIDEKTGEKKLYA